MSNSIEILQNTLLKLIVRQGSDSDRLNILLDSGEFGYTTDGDRLFIGDGSVVGGVPVGNKYLGDGDPTTYQFAQMGDLVYNDVSKSLYKYNGGGYNSLGNWKVVGVVQTAGNSIEINSNNVIGLSGDGIQTNRITPYNSDYLSLPEKTSLNSVDYVWPAGGLQENTVLSTDAYGNLSWKPPVALNTFYVNSSASRIPVGMISPFVSGGNLPYGWLLCNGQSVDGATYRDLSAAIGTTYGGDTINFNVPDLTNKTLYGTVSNPGSSTTFSLASGTNVSLSAVGTNFIIKAIADNLVTSTLTILNTLSGTVDGVDVTGVPVTTLSGNITVGLPALLPASTVQTPFSVDPYGRVSAVPVVLAGIQDVDVINPESYIKYLKTPTTIVTITDSTFTKTTQTVYPTIPGIPINAKTVVLESTINLGNSNQNGIICSAPNIGLLNPTTESYIVGTNEYLVNKARTKFYGGVSSTTQCMIPLSSNGSNQSFFALRIAVQNTDENGSVRIVGYTL